MNFISINPHAAPLNAFTPALSLTNSSVPLLSRHRRLAIQQARMAKKMTQKDLAAACCEPVTVINSYEAGKAIPSGQLIAKLERVLGVKLPRPPKK